MPGEQQFSAQSWFSFRGIDPDVFADIIRCGNSITVVVVLHSLLRVLNINFERGVELLHYVGQYGSVGCG